MKIDLSAFIQDLVIVESLIEYNANVILIKAGFTIEMLEPEYYKKADLYIYQQLIDKLIYLVYETSPDIAFMVGQLSRHNSKLKKVYLQAAKKVI